MVSWVRCCFFKLLNEVYHDLTVTEFAVLTDTLEFCGLEISANLCYNTFFYIPDFFCILGNCSVTAELSTSSSA